MKDIIPYITYEGKELHFDFKECRDSIEVGDIGVFRCKPDGEIVIGFITMIMSDRIFHHNVAGELDGGGVIHPDNFMSCVIIRDKFSL